MSFVDRLLDNLISHPERTRVIEIHGKDERPSDGQAIGELIARARAFLRRAGLRPGDRVGLLAPNSTRWIAADLALLAEGAIVVPLYARQEPVELAAMLKDCGASQLLVADGQLEGAVRAAWPDACPIARFDEIFAAEPATAPTHAFAPDDPVTIIYTSGTSGVPKGVMLTRANVDFMLPRTVARLTEVVGALDREDRIFHFLPLCFAASRIMMWTQLSRPNPLMLSTDLANLVEEMKTAEPNYYLNVPAVLERVRTGVTQKVREQGGVVQSIFDSGLRAYGRIARGRGGLVDRMVYGAAKRAVFGKIRQAIGPRLEFLICGSAPLGEDTQRFFEAMGIPVYQAYGLTETTGIVTLDRPGKVVPGRVGHPLDGIDVRLGAEDELQVRGPNVFAGYWNMPEETAKAKDADGWLHTGDQADVEDGNYRIVGRIKNLVIPESGHNVAPEPLEARFLELCRAATQCMVVGHGRPHLGIIITGDVPPTEIDAAIEQLNAEVPHYRRIRAVHREPTAFSIEAGLLTANQKLRRGAIEKHFAAAIDEMYAK